MATSSAMLIATRALMGVGGAFIMPSTLSIRTAVFPAHERPRAIGIWAGVSGLGIAIGPITGGWLLEHGSGFAAVVLGAFAAWELRVREPMLDVRLFRNRRFSAASAAISLAFFALFGMIIFLTQYLQSVLGYSALESGVRVMPVALGLIVSGPLSARLAQRFGAKVVVAAGSRSSPRRSRCSRPPTSTAATTSSRRRSGCSASASG